MYERRTVEGNERIMCTAFLFYIESSLDNSTIFLISECMLYDESGLYVLVKS